MLQIAGDYSYDSKGVYSNKQIGKGFSMLKGIATFA